MATLNLLGTTSRVETPFIKVTIGNYTFGVYDKTTFKSGQDIYGVYKLHKVRYPNYIQDLTIQKINGTVNKYSLKIEYPVTQTDDPNFFEKVFSSVSKTRKIQFSYGDVSQPISIYRDEEAIITKVRSDVSVQASVISYTVEAISTGVISTSGAYDFRARTAKPSDVIKEILYTPGYGLLDLFYGMSDRELVEQSGLIKSNDKIVRIEAKNNISVLDYLTYLVSCMSSEENQNTLLKQTIYTLVVIDDTSGKFNGPYFKVDVVENEKEISTAYEIDIGYPSQNVVTDFRIDNDESYSIYYDYQKKLHDSEYVERINDEGMIEQIYAPVISSGTAEKITSEEDKTWWTKITEYPIKASITIKGLLRPAILMTYVRLNVYFYGRRHISSGLYIITKQTDRIGLSGFRTTLNLTRIGRADVNEYM